MISEQTQVILLTGVAFANSRQDTDKWPKMNKTTAHTTWQLSASDNNFRTYELWEDSFTIHNIHRLIFIMEAPSVHRAGQIE